MPACTLGYRYYAARADKENLKLSGNVRLVSMISGTEQQ